MKTLIQYINESTNAPTNVRELAKIIKDECSKNSWECNLNHIDVSKMTRLDNLFTMIYGLSEFNGDISKWDVSKVTNMSGMFAGSKFTGENGDIDSYMDYLHNISALIASDGDVQDYLFRETMSALETVECFSRITTQFETIMDTRDDIVNLGIVGEERYIINNGYYKLNENVDMSNLDWVRKAYDKQGVTVISSSHVQNLVAGKYEWVITLGKVLL